MASSRMVPLGSPAPEFAAVHTIEFADTDAAGLLHFSAYFRLMEATEHAFYRSLGGTGFAEDGRARRGMPRVSASCDFLRPIRFEDEVEVLLRVRKAGERKVGYEFEFRVRPDPTPAATGSMIVVHAQRSGDGRFTSAPLPTFLRDAIAGRTRNCSPGGAIAPRSADDAGPAAQATAAGQAASPSPAQSTALPENPP